VVEEYFLVIPVNPPRPLCTLRFFAGSALQILIVLARVVGILCSFYAKDVSKNCELFLVWHKNFDKARGYIASADRLLYCPVCKQNFP
jgi:hypothetical protein